MGFLRTLHVSAVIVGALVVAVEIALIGYWITSGATVIVVVIELLIIAAVAFIALVARYRRIRRELHETTIASAAGRERERIATEMHDSLGHQLSLIALRAGALQVQTSDTASHAAAEIRREVDDATANLHDIIELMQPAGAVSIDDLIRRARDAGIDVRTDGTIHDVDDPGTMRLLYSVVREGLTNATRHAPGRPVDITLHVDDDHVTVSIRTALTMDFEATSPSDHHPRGLSTLGDRVRGAGGTISAEPRSGEFVLSASLPRIALNESSPIPRGRHPLGVLVAQAAVPILVTAAVVVGFYATSSRGAVMEQSTYQAISVGTSEASLVRELPARQAAVRLIHTDSHPRAWRCRYYTDGNFPLAMATYEICTDNGVVTRTTDLRSRPWN